MHTPYLLTNDVLNHFRTTTLPARRTLLEHSNFELQIHESKLTSFLYNATQPQVLYSINSIKNQVI